MIPRGAHCGFSSTSDSRIWTTTMAEPRALLSAFCGNAVVQLPTSNWSAESSLPLSSTSGTPFFHGEAFRVSETLSGPSEASGAIAATPTLAPASAPAPMMSLRRETPSRSATARSATSFSTSSCTSTGRSSTPLRWSTTFLPATTEATAKNTSARPRLRPSSCVSWLSEM